MKTNKFILYAFLVWASCLPTLAKPLKPFELGVQFSSQGVPLKSNVMVTVTIEGTVGGKNISAAISWRPLTNVVPSSDVQSIVAPATLSAITENGTTTIKFPIAAKQNGEFAGRISLQIDGVDISRGIAVLAEGGKVWIAIDSVENCEWTRLTRSYGSSESSLTQSQKDLRNAAYQRILAERRAKAETNLKKNQAKPGGASINAGETVVFTGKWQGPDATHTNADFTMEGVKIVIKDLPGGTHHATGYLVNGMFSFVAPRSNYQFTATLSTEFPGITASGAVATSGGGIGTFNVTKDNADTPGPIYSVTLTNQTNYTSTEAVDGKPFASAWAAFHGMAEMVRQGKLQLGVDKNSNFNILFESAKISAYLGSTSKDIRILLDDRFDWDVVAHEFGHAVADEHSFLSVPAVGGSHNGSNQYDYAPNAFTLNNKGRSLTLAFNEGFGTYFGASLLEKSVYKGRFQNVGDKVYDDTEDANAHTSLELNTAPKAFGDDTEEAIHDLFWDLYDSANESNVRTTAKIAGLKDRVSLGINGLWKLFDNGNFANISDFWKKSYLPGGDIAKFLLPGDNAIDGAKLRQALDAAESFSEFGIAPLLFQPNRGSKIDLSTNSGPTFKWSQEAGVNANLKLNKFTLVIYSQDLKTLIFSKPDLAVMEYTLTQGDLDVIRAMTTNRMDAAVFAAVIGKSDTEMPETGSYLSNGLELLLQDYNRAVVLVVDSSGSNTSTDPSNQRINAAKETVRRLISQSEAQAQMSVPDLAAGIDFDGSVKVLIDFADPDLVVPVFDRIDSSGGTSIDGGINAGIGLLDNINATGIRAFILNKSALIVFTDGQNNSGDGPVIQAIVNATAKGIRVHFGFLQPFGNPRPSGNILGPGESPAIVADVSAAGTGPTTIEEAVIASGGIYGVIGDADSQLAFVNQIFSRGLVNSDNNDPGGGTLPGQITTADNLTDSLQVRSFLFTGRSNENARVIVNATGFRPFLTVFRDDGTILAVDGDDDDNGRIELPLTLPYTGDYVAEVFSQNGNIGPFTIFVDVANDLGTGVQIASASAPTFDRQTSLYRQQLTLTNSSGTSVTGVRVLISGLQNSIYVYNATGTNSVGQPFVQFDGTLAAGGSIILTIEYYSSTRTAVPTPTLQIEPATPVTLPPTPPGAPLRVLGYHVLADNSVLLEFNTIVGKTYQIEYSSDLMTWKASLPTIVSSGIRVLWIDSGPPKTDSLPGTSLRYYRVFQLP